MGKDGLYYITLKKRSFANIDKFWERHI